MEIINVISSNYLLVSLDESRLFFDIHHNREDVIKLRAKLNHDFIVTVERFVKSEDDIERRRRYTTILMSKMPMYVMLIHNYERLSKKWDSQGHRLHASVARVLMENERLNLYQYDCMLYYAGV